MYARGYECIWYFGDEFGFDTFQKYFYSDDEVKAYAKDHFEISGFMNNAGSSLDKNPISRMRNMMKNALTDKLVMPKMMVFVFDADITTFAEKKEINTPRGMEHLLTWLMNEYDKLIACQKDYLPVKSRKMGYPQTIWIEAPLHMNQSDTNKQFRRLFHLSAGAISQFHENTWFLRLKKGWDDEDRSLFLKNEQRFTATGLRKYWEAVNKTVKYADTILLKKPEKKSKPMKMPNIGSTGKENHQNTWCYNDRDKGRSDKYHWHHRDNFRCEQDY